MRLAGVNLTVATWLRADINGLRQEVRTEINGLRQEVRTDINGLRSDVQELDRRVSRIEGHLGLGEASPAS